MVIVEWPKKLFKGINNLEKGNHCYVGGLIHDKKL
jgi:hypothetical protein